MSDKIVIMVDRSAGNETVGEMWTETFIFDESKTLTEVIEKIDATHKSLDGKRSNFLHNVRLQIGKE